MSLAACDYYELLGVERGAPVAAIRRAYLSRARQAHPDKAACSPQAAEDARFVAVQRAWEVLRDECTRAAYDGLLAMGDGRGVLAADAEHAVMAARFTITDELDLCDMTLEQVQGEEEAPCDAAHASWFEFTSPCRCGDAYHLPLTRVVPSTRLLLPCASCSLRVSVTVPDSWSLDEYA